MKTRPFLIATLISALLQGIYYVIITGISLLILPRMLDSLMQDIPTSGGPPQSIFNFMGISFLMGGIGLVLAPIAYAGTGALYAWLHRREEQPVTAEQGALGGAAAAFTARFAAGILVAIGSLLVSNLMTGTITNIIGGTPTATQYPFMYSVLNNMTSVMGSLMGACFGSVIAAMLGALGGALTGAMLK
ncbi:MAG TPA: hypothetical protein PK530_07935 [Anaerolineales bacterium]|nr:hypothetical protein [Anaerolineales bacterium]